MFEEDDADADADESMMSNTMHWTHPQSTLPYFPSVCKSSNLLDVTDQDMESILDDTMYIDPKEEDDDTRDAAASCSHRGSMMDDYSSRILYTCESFDKLIGGNKVSNGNVIRLQPRPRQPKYDQDEALMTTIVPTTPPPMYCRQQPSQPPPSPSATTYTTVSLTQSLLNEDSLFDHDDDNSDSEDEDIGGDNTQDFLERWNRDSSKLFRGMNGNEEADGNNPFQTPKTTHKRSLVMEPPPHKTKKSTKDDTEPYRYLIRMKPHNYIHYSDVGGMEEEKSNDDDITECCSSNITDDYSLPSHHDLSSHMTFHEAFFNKAAVVSATDSSSSLPHMPDW
jgi:hypothetical protein